MTPSDLQKQTTEAFVYPSDPKSPRIDKVREIFATFPAGLRVLDVGCANGAILRQFAKIHELHGVEIAPSLVKIATEAGFKVVNHDLESGPLPYPDKMFDVVFCGETIEHHVDTDWLMFQINRVLRPGGRLVLTYPNIRTPLGIAMLLLLDTPPMYAARYRSVHYRDFTLRVIKIVLRNHRFAPERFIGSSFFLPGIGECGAFLATWLPSWSNTAICVATKVEDSSYVPTEIFSERIY